MKKFYQRLLAASQAPACSVYSSRTSIRIVDNKGFWRIYYIYRLKKGPTWSPDETPEIDALQEAHLPNMRRLGEMGRLVINGPLLDSFAISGEIRGIGVLKANSLAEAQELISTYPMVKVGRLIFELHTWMVGKDILP